MSLINKYYAVDLYNIYQKRKCLPFVSVHKYKLL